MNRQFWRSGRNHACRSRVLWLVIPGLIAAYVYGALALVPRVDIDSEVRDDRPVEPARRSEPREPTEPAEPVVTQQELLPPQGPDACVAAMAAALSNARIEFLSSSVDIVPASRNVISVLAALAHACPGRIEIAGHSDDLGPEQVNRQISIARAQAVASAFIEFGVEPLRLSVRGIGSGQPIADNETREGRARNRRIEISLMEDDPPGQGE